jgi:hypothetical protein
MRCPFSAASLLEEAVGKRIHDNAEADFPLWKRGIEGDFFE